MKTYTEIDSKFRFVILASKRAKQLLHGARPKVKSKSKNPIRVAQNEVRSGLVDYEIIEPIIEEVQVPKEEGFIGEEIGIKEEIEEEAAKKVQRKDKKSKKGPKKGPKKGVKGKPKKKKKSNNKKTSK